MRWTREDYIEFMTFGDVGRPMFCELFGPLIGLPAEWRAQGASDAEIDMTAFDWDYVPYVDCGGAFGAFGTPERVILEETAEYIIEKDYLGRTAKMFKGASTLPQPLDFPVKTMADWQAFKPYYTYSAERVDAAAVEQARTMQEQGYIVRAEIPGGWDTMRELMGEEQACLAYYMDPDLVRDIMHTITDTTVQVLSAVTDKVVIDQMLAHEDMAGKSGPLIGPGLVREFIAPYYRPCWETVSSRGTRLFNFDSDGQIMPIIDAFLDCGVNMMHPFEPAAGMDIVAVRKQYGSRMAMLGGIDKFAIMKSKAAIDKELAYKIGSLKDERGLVFSLDHRIPNGTPLENYRYYVQRGRELLGLPPLDDAHRGWGRMAF